jgi:ribosomal-protein-alanine N-acetyltransferase
MVASRDAQAALFSDLPALETERLILRKQRLEDAADLFAYGSDPEVFRYTGWETYTSLADARSFLESTLARYERGEPAYWGIERRASGRLIGSIGFEWWAPEDFAAEIGYSLGRPYWNQGLMTEALRAVMRFGRDTLDLHRIQARVEAENIGSRRVMEKCGMQYEGAMRECVFGDGRFIDLQLYAILRSERDDA